MRIISALLLSSIGLYSWGQDIKNLDYAVLFQKHKITTRECKEITYGLKADSLKIGDAKFDANGRIIAYTEYFAGGRELARYTYSYDASGKMIASSVAHKFNDFIPVEFILTYDTNNRITSRELKEPIRNYWKKETFTYNATGILVRAEKWYEQGEQLVPMEKEEYPASLKPSSTSLVYLHDPRGLMILHQFFSTTGKVEKALSYRYS